MQYPRWKELHVFLAVLLREVNIDVYCLAHAKEAAKLGKDKIPVTLMKGVARKLGNNLKTKIINDTSTVIADI